MSEKEKILLALERIKNGLIGILISFIITHLICWMYGHSFGLNFKTVVIFLIVDAMSAGIILRREMSILRGEIEILKGKE